ncbi:Uncharacterised protein [Chlamydia trachomatis]|nr:Uncharacterised protein [Chlamydia trachomatis]
MDKGGTAFPRLTSAPGGARRADPSGEVVGRVRELVSDVRVAADEVGVLIAEVADDAVAEVLLDVPTNRGLELDRRALLARAGHPARKLGRLRRGLREVELGRDLRVADLGEVALRDLLEVIGTAREANRLAARGLRRGDEVDHAGRGWQRVVIGLEVLRLERGAEVELEPLLHVVGPQGRVIRVEGDRGLLASGDRRLAGGDDLVLRLRGHREEFRNVARVGLVSDVLTE